MNYHTAFLAAALAPSICLIAPCAAAQKKEKVVAPAAVAVVKRVTPQYAESVTFSLNKKIKAPTISSQNGKLLITAANSRECVRAYGYYLRHVAHVHFSQNGDNTSGAKLILPQKKITVPATHKFNYAYNYCTLSYTGAHWDKKRWERELDMLALSGYYAVLVTPGLESVWKGFLTDLGYSRAQIDAFIANPAYSAWWHMGNLEGEGGPVHRDLIANETKLGKFIVKRLRELGMEPVLQGYVGFLPSSSDAAKIGGTLIPQGKWCHQYERPTILQPTDPIFGKIAAIWYKNLKKVYGYRGKYFGGDLFHEGGRQGGTPLKEAAEAVQAAMQKASPDSKWLIQAWGHNPSEQLLSGTTPENTIILALDKDMSATHNITRNYQGRPHVWCELANFGGNHGLYGGIPLLENMPSDIGGAIGIGLLSEGLEVNPLYYAMVTERINSDGPINRKNFLTDYAKGRYGTADADIIKALELLITSVYSPVRLQEGCQENIMCARPGLSVVKTSTWSKPDNYYNFADVRKAARLMLKAGKKHKLDTLPTWRYDMADLCRQVLADSAREQLPKCKAAFDAGDKAAFARESKAYLKLIEQSAEVLATSEFFLLGRYLQDAENKAGKNKEARAQMSKALKQLFTTWVPKSGTTLNDYAHRQLSELMQHYYLPRWRAYFNARTQELGGQTAAGESGRSAEESNSNNGEAVSTSHELSASVDAIENNFVASDTPLLLKPQGNIIELAERVLNH